MNHLNTFDEFINEATDNESDKALKKFVEKTKKKIESKAEENKWDEKAQEEMLAAEVETFKKKHFKEDEEAEEKTDKK